MQGASRGGGLLSWRTFTRSIPSQHGLWLLRRLGPPFRTLAFSRPANRSSGWGVPTFRCKRRLERPLAACSAPGALGTTSKHKGLAQTSHHSFWTGCHSHFHLLLITTLSPQVACVSIGLRSGPS